MKLRTAFSEISILLVTACAVVSWSHPAAAITPRSCIEENYLKLKRGRLLPKDRGEAELHADLLKTGAESVTFVKKLADGVFQISDATGRNLVVRFNQSRAGNEGKKDSHADPIFEQFAAAFVRAAPGKKTPLVTSISFKDTKAKDYLYYHSILQAIQDKFPDQYAEFLLKNSGRPPTSMSVALFYPQLEGRNYLSYYYGNSFRRLLSNPDVNWADPYSSVEAHSLMIDAMEKIVASWDRMNGDARQTVREDYAKLFGDRHPWKSITDLIRGLKTFTAEERKTLMELGDLTWDRIPPALQRQIAETWALYTVLGITDFHSGNWLLQEAADASTQDTLIAIDLAFKTEYFKTHHKTKHYSDEFSQSPMSAYWMAPGSKMRQKLIAAFSPEFKLYLWTLTPRIVMKIAEQNSFPITQIQAQGVIERIKIMLPLKPLRPKTGEPR